MREQSLLVICPSGSIEKLRVTTEQAVVIGHGADCQFRSRRLSIARKHCRLTLDSQGILVEDFGSLSGSYINSRRIQKAYFHAGDLLHLGDITIMYDAGGVQVKEASQKPDDIFGAKPLPDCCKTTESLTYRGPLELFRGDSAGSPVLILRNKRSYPLDPLKIDKQLPLLSKSLNRNQLDQLLRVRDIHASNNIHFVLEDPNGSSLRQLIESDKQAPLASKKVLALGLQLLLTIEFVVTRMPGDHPFFTPEDIFLRAGQQWIFIPPSLMSFFKRTRSLHGSIKGPLESYRKGAATPFLPPEYRTDDEVLGILAAQYCVGANLYYAASKQAPTCTQQGILPLESARQDLPENLCAFITKCLAQDPNERYQDFDSAREVLTSALRQIPR